ALENVVTLYDAVYNVMAGFDSHLAVSDASKVSFTQDIYPILRRVSQMHWVSQLAAGRHGEGTRLHFISRVDEFSSNNKKPGALNFSGIEEATGPRWPAGPRWQYAVPPQRSG